MKFFVLFFLMFSFLAQAQKPRLIVMTDIGQDPDDEQSMVRLLHYANEFEIEGLIATADNNYEHEPPVLHDEIIHKMIDDYDKSRTNFLIHSGEYPTAEFLRTKVKKGNDKGGEKVPVERFIGKSFDTEGSDWIIQVADRPDEWPVCISVWGGACDLAQALWKVKTTRNEEEVQCFVRKLRVYFIGKQDASNQWIIDNFPDLWLVLALDPSGDKWQSGYRGMFWGGDMSNTTRDWIHNNIHGHSLLADNYPDRAHTGGEGKNPHNALKEGDTPSFLYFLENGLNQSAHPDWGGWGGRFTEERPHFFRDASDVVFDVSTGENASSPRATVFRWREDFQNDVAARADWGSTPVFDRANHHPVIRLGNDSTKNPIIFEVKPGAKLKLDATKTTDPDGDELDFEWFEYAEPGNCGEEINRIANDKGNATFFIPENGPDCESHIILKVTDSGKPKLSSYKRIILQLKSNQK